MPMSVGSVGFQNAPSRGTVTEECAGKEQRDLDTFHSRGLRDLPPAVRV